MFGKKKNKANEVKTVPDAVNEQEKAADNNQASEVQFEKNIKTLWIYTTLFCLFALILIVVSSVIQSKINSKAEYYQDQYESAQTSSQSTIKNIQDENAALKRDIETYKSKAERLEQQSTADSELLNDAAELIENAQYLLSAQQAVTNGKLEEARAELKKVNPEKLSDVMKTVYDALVKRLD